MMPADHEASLRRFTRQYALANVGAFLCFIPLISLLLPQMAVTLSPAASDQLLSWTLLAGAVAASIGNLAAGQLSDRLLPSRGSRLPLVGIGLGATLVSFAALAMAATPPALIAAFILFQLCFNLLFAPFNALAADHIPDHLKGRVFGLLSLGLPLAQLAIFVIVALALPSMALRLLLVAALALLAFLPLLVGRGTGRHPPYIAAAARPPTGPSEIDDPSGGLRDFALVWLGRLLVQCAAVAAGSYLFLHLTQLAVIAGRLRVAEQWMGTLSLVSLGAGLTIGVAIGRLSDGIRRRRPFLVLTALLVGAGCALIGAGDCWMMIAAGYGLFAVGLTGFLTIDGAVVAQLVGRGDRRGVRLGLMNLTNTLPALMVPAMMLTIRHVAAAGAAELFLLAAAGSVLGSLLMAGLRTIR